MKKYALFFFYYSSKPGDRQEAGIGLLAERRDRSSARLSHNQPTRDAGM